MTKQEILDNLTQRLYGKPYDEITPEEREDLRQRVDKLLKGEDDDAL
jgi:hypothetical protein